MSHDTIEALRRTVADADQLERNIRFYQKVRRAMRRDLPKQAGLILGSPLNVESLTDLPEEDRDRFWALILPAANQFCDEMIAKHQKAYDAISP
jgi:hypothetical protein